MAALRRCVLLSLTLLGAGVAACTDGPPEAPATRSDGPTASLAIGEPVATFRAGLADTIFLDGAVDIARWGDRLVAVETASAELKFFDRELRYLGHYDIQGEGPGELQQPWSVASTPSGSLAVVQFDSRLQLFSAEMKYLGGFRYTGFPPQSYAALSDDAFAWGLMGPEGRLAMVTGDGASVLGSPHSDVDDERAITSALVTQAGVGGDGSPVLVVLEERRGVTLVDASGSEIASFELPPELADRLREASEGKEVAGQLLPTPWTRDLVPVDDHRFLVLTTLPDIPVLSLDIATGAWEPTPIPTDPATVALLARASAATIFDDRLVVLVGDELHALELRVSAP